MITKETSYRQELVVSDGLTVVVPSEGQAILYEQYSIFRKSWKWILVVAILATASVTAYFMTMVPVEYMATVTIVPPNKSGSPLDNILGGVSASLKDFGLSKLVGSKSGEAGYSKLAVLQSRSVLDSLIRRFNLFAEYKAPPNRFDLVRDNLRSRMNYVVDAEGPIILSVYDQDPVRATQIANEVVAIANSLSRELNKAETEPITKMIGARYNEEREQREILSGRIQELMRKYHIYDPEKQASAVGSALADAEANVRMQRITVEIYEGTLGSEDPKTIQAKQLLAQYESESKKFASGQGGVIPGLSLNDAPPAAMDAARLQTDYEINGKLLALLQPMYEQSKLDEIRNIPVLNILDSAVTPTRKARPHYSVVVASSFVGSFLTCYVIIALLAFFKAFNRRYKAYAVTTVASVNGASKH